MIFLYNRILSSKNTNDTLILKPTNNNFSFPIFGNFQGLLLVLIFHCDFTCLSGMNGIFCHSPITPFYIHGISSTCPETCHATLIPLLGKCWKKFYDPVTTLKEHFADTGSAPEIAINLEWWMGIEQVGISATGATTIRSPIVIW